MNTFFAAVKGVN